LLFGADETTGLPREHCSRRRSGGRFVPFLTKKAPKIGAFFLIRHIHSRALHQFLTDFVALNTEIVQADVASVRQSRLQMSGNRPYDQVVAWSALEHQ